MSTTNRTNRSTRDRIAVPTRDPDSEFETEEVELKQLEEQKTNQYPSKNSNAPKLTDKVSQYVVSHLERNTKVILFPAFVTCAIGSAIILLLGFINIFSQLLGLIIIMILTIVTAYIAMYGLYKWGAITDYIEHYKKQNAKYKDNTIVLKKTSIQMKDEVTKMQSSVGVLESETIELHKCVEQFDELHEALLEVCGDDQEILNVIDKLNGQYNDMKVLANQKDKAQLLLAYYRVQFGGYERDKFGRDDYERFLGRLNSGTRKVYDKLGGFDAMDLDKNGNVDPNEFMKMTSLVLEHTDDKLMEFTKPKTIRKENI